VNVNCVKIYSSFPRVVEEVCGVDVVDLHVLFSPPPPPPPFFSLLLAPPPQKHFFFLSKPIFFFFFFKKPLGEIFFF